MWFASIFSTVLAGIVALFPVRHLGLPRWAEIFLGLLLVTMAQRYFAVRLFRTSVLAPEAMPPPLVLFFLWGEIFLLLAALLTLPWGVARLCGAPLGGAWPLALAAALGSWMLWMGFRQPPVREHEVVLPGLPEAAEGMRVAVLADLHLDPFRNRAWAERLVARTNALKPDLVLLTGDQSDGMLEARRGDLEALAGLRAPLGVYAISGNHEWFFDQEALMDFHERLGIHVLDGRTAQAGALWLVGLPDCKSLTSSNNGPLLRRLMGDLPPGAFPVVLVHKPGIAAEADALGARLQLSGHTHGGQFPGLATLIARRNAGLVGGWYGFPGGLKVFVAPGSGVWSGWPYRLYGSELSLLVLRGQR